MLLHSMYDYSMLDILASIPIWLYYIPFLLFAILLPCIWHLSFVHAGFSLCNALCHSSFYHYSYSVLPLFLLRHAIIASSMLTAIIHPDGASLVQQTSGDFIWYQSSYYSNESESSDLINRVIWTLTPTLVVPTQDRELLCSYSCNNAHVLILRRWKWLGMTSLK